ncbi:MAG: hypothetical protein V8S54_11185 [Lachnospiraceae bacterium]
MKKKADQKIKSLKKEAKEKETSFWQIAYMIFLVFEMIKKTVVQNDLFACITVPVRVWCRYIEWVIHPSELNISGERGIFFNRMVVVFENYGNYYHCRSSNCR